MFMRACLLGLIILVGCAHHPKPEVVPQNEATEAAQAASLFEEGQRLAEVGDLTRAEQYLATALREGHRPDLTLRVLLSVCVRASRLRSALAYAGPYLMAHPSDVRLRQLVASIQLSLGDFRAAERELRQVLRQLAGDDQAAAESEFLLAIILQQYSGREGEAGAHFARYVALSPNGIHAEEARSMLGAMPEAASQID